MIPHYEQIASFHGEDVVELAGFKMAGPGLGKAIRGRFAALVSDLMQKHGRSAFEMPKRAAAIHEAGHVLVMSLLGVRVTSVLINPVARSGKLYWGGNTEAPELAFADTPAFPIGFDILLDRSRIVYAGLAAELLFAGEDKREGSSLDEIVMSQLLAERAASLIGTCPEHLWRDEVATWCHSQIYRNRDAHAEIAAALMKRGRLKGKVLRELCAKVSPPDEVFPDIQDHTSQLSDAEIIQNDAEVWA